MTQFSSDREAAAAARQERYEKRYDEKYEERRPKPELELWELEGLAKKALEDPGAALDWAAKATPQTFLHALAAQRWDESNPFYSCIECKDGKLLPEGYVCAVCGADNPR